VIRDSGFKVRDFGFKFRDLSEVGHGVAVRKVAQHPVCEYPPVSVESWV